MRCSTLSGFAGEPLAGTAATATAWLCLEQPGPWGRDALVQSHLDPELGAELSRRAAGTGVRILLIRRPGKHADTHAGGSRRVYLASTEPGASWLEQADLDAPEEALELDFEALGQGRSTAFGTPVADPLLLVCTNSKRDVCCALYGRPIATALNLWECTHTGGHRFAPTGVLLPTGHLYGRLDHELAEHVVTKGIVADRCRGRSCFTPRGRARVAGDAGRTAGAAAPGQLREVPGHLGRAGGDGDRRAGEDLPLAWAGCPGRSTSTARPASASRPSPPVTPPSTPGRSTS